jgi:hypothetical protein
MHMIGFATLRTVFSQSLQILKTLHLAPKSSRVLGSISNWETLGSRTMHFGGNLVVDYDLYVVCIQTGWGLFVTNPRLDLENCCFFNQAAKQQLFKNGWRCQDHFSGKIRTIIHQSDMSWSQSQQVHWTTFYPAGPARTGCSLDHRLTFLDLHVKTCPIGFVPFY